MHNKQQFLNNEDFLKINQSLGGEERNKRCTPVMTLAGDIFLKGKAAAKI